MSNRRNKKLNWLRRYKELQEQERPRFGDAHELRHIPAAIEAGIAGIYDEHHFSSSEQLEKVHKLGPSGLFSISTAERDA